MSLEAQFEKAQVDVKNIDKTPNGYAIIRIVCLFKQQQKAITKLQNRYVRY